MGLVLCEICLVPTEPWRLKPRDLSAFYALNPTAFEGILQDKSAWLCAFCWTRVCQCVHFIDTAITSRIFLSAKNRLAAIPITDIHTYVVKSLPCWEAGSKPANDTKMKAKRKGKKTKPIDSEKSLSKEALSKNLERADIDVDSSSKPLFSFPYDTILLPNLVVQECYDYKSETCETKDELNVIHPKEIIQTQAEIIETPGEEVKERPKFPSKYTNTGESEFLRFLELKQKAMETKQASSSSFFGNTRLPRIKLKEQYVDNMEPVNDKQGSIDAPEKVCMSIDVKEEPLETFFTSEYINERSISTEPETSFGEIGAELSKESKNKENGNVPEFEQKVEALKNTTVFCVNYRPVEDVQMLGEVKEEPFEAFNMPENKEESIISDEAVTTSKVLVTQLKSVSKKKRGHASDIVPKFKENKAATTNGIFCMNQRPVKDLSVGNIWGPNTSNISDTVNDVFKRPREQK